MRNSNNILALFALLLSTLPASAQFGGQSVAAGSWEPLAIRTKAGIVTHFSHAHTNTITLNGDGVSQWRNRVPNAATNTYLNQTTALSQPIYDTTNMLAGRPTLFFNGSAFFLKTAAFTLNQPTEVIAGVRPWTWTVNDSLFDGFTASYGVVYQATATPEIRLYAGGTSFANTNLATGSPAVLVSVLNGASSSLRVNNTTASTGSPGPLNMGGFTLGSKADGSTPSHAQFSDIIITSKTNAPPELQWLKYGMMRKAGVL